MSALAVETVDPATTYCECGCGEPVNDLYMRALRLRESGLSVRDVARRLDITLGWAKRVLYLARRGEWPKFVRGHHRNDATAPRKKCEFPPCPSMIPGFWHHCSDHKCQSARLYLRLGVESDPGAAWSRVEAGYARSAQRQQEWWERHQAELTERRRLRREEREREKAEVSRWRALLRAERRARVDAQRALLRAERRARVDAQREAAKAEARLRAAIRAERRALLEETRAVALAARAEVREQNRERRRERAERDRAERQKRVVERRVKRQYRWSENVRLDNDLRSDPYKRADVDTSDLSDSLADVPTRAEIVALAKQAPVIPADFMRRCADGELTLVVDDVGVRFITHRTSRVDAVPWQDAPGPIPSMAIMSPGKMRGRGGRRTRQQQVALMAGKRPSRKQKADR